MSKNWAPIHHQMVKGRATAIPSFAPKTGKIPQDNLRKPSLLSPVGKRFSDSVSIHDNRECRIIHKHGLHRYL